MEETKIEQKIVHNYDSMNFSDARSTRSFFSCFDESLLSTQKVTEEPSFDSPCAVVCVSFVTVAERVDRPRLPGETVPTRGDATGNGEGKGKLPNKLFIGNYRGYGRG